MKVEQAAREIRASATMPPPGMPHASEPRIDVSMSTGESMPPPTSTSHVATTQPRTSLPVAAEAKTLDAVADGMRKVGDAMMGAFASVGDLAARFGVRAKNTVRLFKEKNDTDEPRR